MANLFHSLLQHPPSRPARNEDRNRPPAPSLVMQLLRPQPPPLGRILTHDWLPYVGGPSGLPGPALSNCQQDDSMVGSMTFQTCSEG
jgi:hypothetical protein